MEDIMDWLLEGPAYVRYRTLLDLKGLDDEDSEVLASRNDMLTDPGITGLIEECKQWPGPVLKRHNDAKLLIHKLAFLSEIGLNRDDPGIQEIANMVMSNQDPLGPFRVKTHLYERFGGSGEDEYAWFLCDAPTIVYSLARMGYQEDTRVKGAAQYLTSLIHENGWRCTVSKELGNMKGPGGRKVECPYSNLLMLKMLSAYPDLMDGSEAKTGIDIILQLWSDRKKRKPFLFAMGTDFKKLKAPLIWYDIIHVSEVLSRSTYALKDERMKEILDILESKADDNGRYTAESIWMAWKGWDFAQKKEPSRWITYRVLKILSNSIQ